MLKPLVTMREALEDAQLLGSALHGPSWFGHRTMLIAAMGETLTAEEREFFEAVTGRPEEPGERVDELWEILGRRSGKTRSAGTMAAYVGGLCDHSEYLAPGERGVLPILAATATQAGRAFMHAKAILQTSPVLAGQIEGEPTSDTIRLTTGIDIEVRPANFRTIRGITAPAAIADEVAFWLLEGSSNPDAEILEALRPALATTGGPLMVISSPYARRGELYQTYRRHYGPDGNRLVLVAKAASRTFNPLLPERVIAEAYERDPSSAAAEYGAEFRTDVETLLTREAIEAVTATDRRELPPVEGIQYNAWTDPSGGSVDSWTLAVAHRSGDTDVLDLVRERRPPFSPEAVVSEYAAVLRAYGISSVTGDRYAGEFPRELFRNEGIEYVVADRTASDTFRELLPLINSARVELLDHPRLTEQLVALERRTSRTGKDLISHPPGGHDDLAAAVAGVLGRAHGDAFNLETYIRAYS